MDEWIMKEYIHQASYKIVVNKLQKIKTFKIHLSNGWMKYEGIYSSS
jgi:hypothetical protein